MISTPSMSLIKFTQGLRWLNVAREEMPLFPAPPGYLGSYPDLDTYFDSPYVGGKKKFNESLKIKLCLEIAGYDMSFQEISEAMEELRVVFPDKVELKDRRVFIRDDKNVFPEDDRSDTQ